MADFKGLVLIAAVCLVVCCNYGTDASFKKGVGGYSGKFFCDDLKALTNISWWYDWHRDLSVLYDKQMMRINCPQQTDHSGLQEYVPMIWSWHDHKGHPWVSRGNITVQPEASYVLGFNEPTHADQANMTAQQCADAWPEIERISQGKKLVAPVPAGHNLAWMEDFMHKCRGCRIDYVAAHSYHCDADDIMGYLHTLYNKFGKKVWLTEFACPHTDDVNKQLHLMQTLLPRLEAADYVYRYAWFSTRRLRTGWVHPSASLLEADSSTLTRIGRYYNHYEYHAGHHIVG